MARERSAADVRINVPRCPYCHEDVRVEELKHGCPRCMAWHHEDCWEEAGQACSACGVSEVEAEGEDDELEAEDARVRYVAPRRSLFVKLLAVVAVLMCTLAGTIAFALIGWAIASLLHDDVARTLVVIASILIGYVVGAWVGVRVYWR